MKCLNKEFCRSRNLCDIKKKTLVNKDKCATLTHFVSLNVVVLTKRGASEGIAPRSVVTLVMIGS